MEPSVLKAAAVAFLACALALLILYPLAERLSLIDHPNERKIHAEAIPLIGGIAVFVGLLVAITHAIPLTSTVITYLACALAILVLGILDDIRNLPVLPRITGQVLITLLLLWGSGRTLSHFGNLFGMGPIDIGHLGIVVAVLSSLAAINAFNMVDGMDGLAGGLALVTLLSLGYLYLDADIHSGFLLSMLLAAAIIPYLVLNLGMPPFGSASRIFMGDAGSMLIGFSIFWLLMHGSQSQETAFRPVTALWLMGIPLMDMIAIMVRRVQKGMSPFKADQTHLHHIFMRAGYSPRATLHLIVLSGVVIASLGITMDRSNVPDWAMFTSFIVLQLAYLWFLRHIWHVLRRWRSFRGL
jgi:UDP-GlcNAc:undecaprenyl-phosphate GlcNAc-1-phosphate transferase